MAALAAVGLAVGVVVAQGVDMVGGLAAGVSEVDLAEDLAVGLGAGAEEEAGVGKEGEGLAKGSAEEMAAVWAAVVLEVAVSKSVRCWGWCTAPGVVLAVRGVVVVGSAARSAVATAGVSAVHSAATTVGAMAD